MCIDIVSLPNVSRYDDILIYCCISSYYIGFTLIYKVNCPQTLLTLLKYHETCDTVALYRTLQGKNFTCIDNFLCIMCFAEEVKNKEWDLL